MPNPSKASGSKASSKKQYVGVFEIAVLARVSPQAVSNWRVRSLRTGDPFPKPIADLASGPVFLKGEVMDWLGRNGKLVRDETEDVG